MFQKYLLQVINYTLFVLILSSLASCGGGSTTTSTDSKILAEENHGVAQKGPFAVGSEVTIEKLDSSGISFGETINTTVSGESGKFSFQLPSDWGADSFIKLDVTGSVLDEALGSLSTDKLSLSAIVTASQKQNSINILTNWLTQRAQNLLLEGNDLNSALQQAEQELKKIFGISNVGLLDYTSTANHLLEDNASLLLLSGALMGVADNSKEDIQVIINQMADDFAMDGSIDQSGDDWFKRLQAEIRDNPTLHTSQFSQALEDALGLKTVSGNKLPKVINLASRPTSIVPKEIIARPNETIVLDGTASHDSSEKSLINFTWFRVDQQSFSPLVVISDRFLENPTITVPNIESELLYALVVTDTDKLTDTSVLKVIVKKPDPLNIPPVVKDQSFVIDEDTELDIVLDASDADGDSLVYSFDTPLLLSNSIVEGSPPSIKYIPDNNFNGTSLFTYTVHDGSDTSNVGTVKIEVLPVNDKPSADSQTLFTQKNQSLTNILLTGSDVDAGDTLSFFIKDNPQHGSLQGNAVNYSYTPETDYIGNDSFTFLVNDGSLDSNIATVSIEVFSENQSPIAVDDNYTTNEDTSVQLDPLAGDSDPDTDIVTVTKINGVSLTNGVAQTISVSDGQVDVSASGSFSFIPDANFFGSVSFSYTISDGKGGTDSATENITVTSVNDAPKAVNDHFTKDEDTPVTGNVISNITNDTDPENDTLIVIAAKIDTNGDSSKETISLTSVTQIIDAANNPIGTIGISANGNFTFTPALNVNGEMPQLIYTISDGNGGTDTATLDISITPVNDAPTARSFTLSFKQGDSVSFTKGPGAKQLGGSDPENDAIHVIGVTDPVNNPSSLISYSIGATTIYSYSPPASFCGTDSINYMVKESGIAPPIRLFSDFATVTFNVACKKSPGKAYLKAEAPDPFDASGLDGGDSFGKTLAISANGSTIVVGAAGPTKNDVYIYSFDTTNGWEYQTTFQSPSGFSSGFADAIAISNDGNRVLVGAPLEDDGATGVNNILAGRSARAVVAKTIPEVLNSGAAYLYKRSLTTGDWALTTRFKANTTDVDDRFGTSVSISGDGKTIAIGAPDEDSGDSNNENDNTVYNAGAVYIFERDASNNWSQEAYLKASNISDSDDFGASVDLDEAGNSLLIGATGEDTSQQNSGAIYYFTKDSGNPSWSQQQMIKQNPPIAYRRFGSVFDLSDDGKTFIASDTSAKVQLNGVEISAGAAYIFNLNLASGMWSQIPVPLTASNPAESDHFGSSVSITANGDKVIVGASGYDEYIDPIDSVNDIINSGATYIFNWDGTSWLQEIGYIKATNVDEYDNFGETVAISSTGETIVIGAPSEQSCAKGVDGDQDDNNCPWAGAVYVNPNEFVGDL